MLTLTYATLTAHLDPMTGEGLLVLPSPGEDVASPCMGPSLQAADWDHAVRALDRLGWEPSEGDDGGMLDVGSTVDGRQVVGLYGRDPIVTMPSLDQVAESFERLSTTIGLTRARRPH